MFDVPERAKTLTEEILKKLNFPYNAIAATKEENNIIRVNIDTDSPSLLIGWHGETINSLQHLLKNLLWNKEEVHETFFIIIDTDNYKKRQEENVIHLSEERARKVSATHPEETLPPMSSYFRRIIHLHFASQTEFKHIKTESIGDADMRQIKLMYNG